MTNIFPSRGCIYAFQQQGNSVGFYALNPPITSSNAAPVLIMGASLQDPDVLVPKNTLDNFHVLYSFGAGFGSVNIMGVALLGNEKSGGKSFAEVVKWFQKNRASNLKKPVQLSLPGKVAYNVYISGLVVGQIDPKFHTQQFVLGGIVAETSSGPAAGRKDGFTGLTTGSLVTSSLS